MKEKIFFTHIKKTAGSSAHEALFERNIPKSKQRQPKGLKNLLVNTDPFRYMKGHFPYGVHRFAQVFETPYYFVILRDPVERAVSQYYMAQTWDQPPGHPLHELADRDLMDFYQSPWVHNLQTRTIAGVLAHRVGGLLDLNKRVAGKLVLKMAQRNLTGAYAEFGLTEKFEETVARFAHRLGWSYELPERKHASLPERPTKKDLSSEKINKLERVNSMDCELYEFAKMVFEKRRNR